MAFSEKLYKLRKEKGLSQEALAEKLNTSRQAISKWENGQGFPETEKLLMIGNIFEVSIDYLLKDTVEQSHENEQGYYVSREMAEGFLLHERKTSKYIALGMSLLILVTVPYIIFKHDPAIYTFLIIIIAVLGIGALMAAAVIDEGNKYKILRKETLLFDQNYHKELTARYENMKKRYAPVMILSFCIIAAGGLPFILEEKEITSGFLVPYYPYCVALMAVGAYIFIRTVAILDTYKLLVINEEHTNRLSYKIRKKVKEKLDNF
ncbi:helix-turn-helix domain-containing protein [Cytobacillus dafuensis]|uniref:Helix-turn-helix transcriptional regulator n=1 Tax=Cytobacillus dafuensis TaxID=1742359 RepID=A0A5B8Z0Q4_CYTDA|nr:helix-turn-helix transcriptional regulator [Cytobacillus dafuensis]QED46478.1 helix-turn-helix transcriptional regulator [Cytobacillus dafuensis]